jgi:hypothetical protein
VRTRLLSLVLMYFRVRVVGGTKMASYCLPMLRLLDCRTQILLLDRILLLECKSIDGRTDGEWFLFLGVPVKVRHGFHFQPPWTQGWLRGNWLLLFRDWVHRWVLLLFWVLDIRKRRLQELFLVFLLQDYIRGDPHNLGVVGCGR